MKRLEGKVCIVTGGAQGIGRAIVDVFASENAKVVYSVDLAETTFKQDNVEGIILNTTDKGGMKLLVESIVKKHDRIDVVVNNAGITRDALTHKMTDDQWDMVIDVNLKAPHILMALVGPQMMKQQTGSIVSISSVSGVYGNVGQANYAATKAGLIGMTKSWTKEFSRKGGRIRANAIAPGFINTPILSSMPDNVLDGMRSKILFGEIGEPIDVANAALFLASDESKYVTSQVLEVSGGIKL